MTDAKAKTRHWLQDAALPFWAQAGMDHAAGGFVERLTPAGVPDLDAPKRSLVQARQIYVYSHAALLGLAPDGAEAASNGFDFLIRHACPDGAANGFVQAMWRDGTTADPHRDTYTHAFLLFAFAWFYKATRRRDALRAIEDVLSALETLRHASGRGFAEGSNHAQPRRQNPHMHLLEAYLAVHDATGHESALEGARHMHRLFTEHFSDGLMLREYFADDLSRQSHPLGEVVEPGHHFEWIYLLQQYGRLTGDNMKKHMTALHRTATRHGIEPQSGLVYNEIWSDGAIKDAAKRLWPHTELLKAELALGLGHPDATVERLFLHFLTPEGTWTDRLDAQNRPLPGPVPASSFYHLFLAFAEYLEGA